MTHETRPIREIDGTKLRRVREGQGLARSQVVFEARLRGYPLSERAVTAIELGEQPRPNWTTLDALLNVLNVSLDELTSDVPQEEADEKETSDGKATLEAIEANSRCG